MNDLEEAFQLAGRNVGSMGSSASCFIIAEAGVNHNGNLQTAHDLIDAAVEAGADAVKFQTWITDKICRPGAKKAGYQRDERVEDEDQYAMLKRLELPYPWHRELKAHAEKRGILFLSTPDEIDSARFLCELGIAAIKIGSGELTNLPFLRQLGRLGKPLILSTGMGTIAEVAKALEAARAEGPVPIALLHCVSAYPAPEAEMNLRCIQSLRDEFKVPVGLSDHTTGQATPLLGVGLGMAIWEKHLTLDRKMFGPDHAASAEPDDLAELIRAIRKAELMMGTGIKESAASEESTREAVRRTLLYAGDLPAGHHIRLSDMEALRCGLPGLPPEVASQLDGRVLLHSVNGGQVVSEVHFK